MGFLSMFFGDPERKRRENQQKDSEQDYLRHKKLVDAKQAAPKRLQPIVKSKRKGKAFVYRSLGSTNPDALFTWAEPQGKLQHKKKRRQQPDFSLI